MSRPAERISSDSEHYCSVYHQVFPANLLLQGTVNIPTAFYVFMQKKLCVADPSVVSVLLKSKMILSVLLHLLHPGNHLIYFYLSLPCFIIKVFLHFRRTRKSCPQLRGWDLPCRLRVTYEVTPGDTGFWKIFPKSALIWNNGRGKTNSYWFLVLLGAAFPCTWSCISDHKEAFSALIMGASIASS